MAHDFKNFPELTNNQMQLYYFDSPHKQITEDFSARVVNVHDGDSIRVEWNEREFDFPIRLAYIQAPELDEEGGRESRDWLSEKILGEEVDITINPKNRVDKWGRILGTINHFGINLNMASIDEGKSMIFEEAA